MNTIKGRRISAEFAKDALVEYKRNFVNTTLFWNFTMRFESPQTSVSRLIGHQGTQFVPTLTPSAALHELDG